MSDRITIKFTTYDKEEGFQEYEAVTVRTKYTETVVAYMDKEGNPYPVVMPREEVGN